MREATARQKRETARLITRTAEPLTFDEATRLIGRLRREQRALPELVEQIVAAIDAGDDDMLGRLLRREKPQIAHGGWAMFLGKFGVHPRRAQRLMARTKKGKST